MLRAIIRLLRLGFVGRILENLFVNFSGSTRAGIEALPDQEAAAHARARLDKIMRRRASEEEA